MDSPGVRCTVSRIAGLNVNATAFIPANALQATAPEFSPLLRREYHGATVHYGPGAEVLQVRLTSDTSSIQIKGLSDASPANVQKVFDVLGINFPVASIQMNQSELGIIATIRFDDPAIAQLVLEKFAGSGLNSKLTMSLLINLPKPFQWVQLGGVKCSWTKKGSMAFIEYPSSTPGLESLSNNISHLLTPSGQAVKCIATRPSPYERTRHLRSFSLNNLDTNTNVSWVKETLANAGYPVPKKIKMVHVGSGTTLDDARCVTTIEGLLRSIGPLDSFSSAESTNGGRLMVNAIFCNPGDAKIAVSTLKDKFPVDFPASKKLTIEHEVSMKVNILDKIASALDTKLQALCVEMQKNGRDRVQIRKQHRKGHTMVRFSDAGEHAVAELAKFKIEIEKLLVGTVVYESGVPVWDKWFGISEDAGKYLHWVSSTCKVYVLRSVAQGHLILYGGTDQHRRRAGNLLKAKIADLKVENAYTIRLAKDKSISETLEVLKPVFGDKLRLVVSGGSNMVKLLGSVADISKARLLLNPSSAPQAGECPICWGTPEEAAIHLDCGHTYCLYCFHDLCAAPIASEHLLPISCSGTTTTGIPCTHLINLSLLASHLTAVEFEHVLQLSFDFNVHTHPALFAFCRTIDCSTIYRRSSTTTITTTPTLTTCSSCLHTFDTLCGYHHPLLTCAEYADVIDGTDALLKNSKELGVKRCPSCRQALEKTGGCNHMTCGCGQHFCWVCGMGFEGPEETVSHLNEVHGGIESDDEDEDDDDDDDDDEDELQLPLVREDFDDGWQAFAPL
ncbi:uncharacterized protein RSE6_13415 [Rhynchosporium secalis]|uniref:RING-type domain-containing protein n=1 Tax=Rhynchosporium secalis TaxID=38038 RepID=A0A1E1MSU2_RHYSE|nr:uncharacterized protein RSE6_13415 [Rhynchosporium secalis]